MRKYLFAVIFLIFGCVSAQATYEFTSFNATSPWHTNSWLKITLDVLFESSEAVRFRISNNSSIDCAVTAIYFDEGGELGGIHAIYNGNGNSVVFNKGANPNQIPGASIPNPDFTTSTPLNSFSASAKSPSPTNGLNKGGEFVDLVFSLNNSYTFDSIIAGIASGAIRVGLHVQAFPNGASSTSMINNDAVNPVPEPATCALIALGSLVCFKRKK